MGFYGILWLIYTAKEYSGLHKKVLRMKYFIITTGFYGAFDVVVAVQKKCRKIFTSSKMVVKE